MARINQGYPFVSLESATAATVTRRRPLPLGALREQVAYNAGAGDVQLVAG